MGPAPSIPAFDDDPAAGSPALLLPRPDDRIRRTQEAMLKALPTFEHGPSKSDKHFRLLCIHPTIEDIPTRSHIIRCSLEEHHIDDPDCPPYTAISYAAISYTKGSEKAERVILLQDRSPIWKALHATTFPVREDLLQLLDHLVDPKHVRRMWIDALCVDQKSLPERNAQTQQMSKIFGQANYVIAWLQSSEHEGKNLDMQPLFKLMASTRTVADRNSLTSIAAFCDLRYWSRVWTIPELVQASSVLLQYEEQTLPLQAMVSFFGRHKSYGQSDPGWMEVVQRESNSDSNAMSSETQYSDGSEQRDRSENWPSWQDILRTPCARMALHIHAQRQSFASLTLPLHELLCRFGQSQCPVPCDHVYAMYNLMGKHSGYLQIDYAQDPCDRFHNVLVFLQQHDGLPAAHFFSYMVFLQKVLGLTQTAMLKHKFSGDHHLRIVAFDLGEAQKVEESSTSQSRRRSVDALRRVPSIALNMVQYPWTLAMPSLPGESAPELYSAHDLTYFRATKAGLHGLATPGLKSGDMAWIFHGVPSIFIVRRLDDRNMNIIGRGYFWPDNEKRPVHHSLMEPRRFNAKPISLSMGMLVKLHAWATGPE